MIDTPAKRFAMLNFRAPVMTVLPKLDGTTDARITRGHWLRLYNEYAVPRMPSGQIPDNSYNDNPAQILGDVPLVPFNRCTVGVCCDEVNYVQITGQVGDQLQGWRRDSGSGQPWRFFEDGNLVPEIEKVGNDYLLKNGCYAHLMLSSQPVLFAALLSEDEDKLLTEDGDTIVTG